MTRKTEVPNYYGTSYTRAARFICLTDPLAHDPTLYLQKSKLFLQGVGRRNNFNAFLELPGYRDIFYFELILIFAKF